MTKDRHVNKSRQNENAKWLPKSGKLTSGYTKGLISNKKQKQKQNNNPPSPPPPQKKRIRKWKKDNAQDKPLSEKKEEARKV